MALTPKTREFHRLREELDQKVAQSGGISTEELQSFLQEKNVDPADFKQAWNEFSSTGYEQDRPGMLMGRIAGRAVGATVEGLGRLVLPKSAENSVERFLDEKLPEGVKKTMSELFDPYHGDGWVEPLAAELASILIPYGGAMKGYKLIRGIPTKPQKVIKEKRTAPALFGSVQEQVLKPHLKEGAKD